MTEGKTLWHPDEDGPFLQTTPGTMIEFRSKMWCTGHKGMPRWLHRTGHRLHLLRVKPLPKLRYIDER